MAKKKPVPDALNSIGEIFEIFSMDSGFTRTKPPKNVVTHKTGWGDEIYYHDADGNIRHIPARTTMSHPYSYDPIVLFNDGNGEHGAYSDRMVSWDYEKFRKCMSDLNDGQGELAFRWGNKALVTKFCQAYYDDPTLVVTKVTEMCNASTGYPLWYILWNDEG